MEFKMPEHWACTSNETRRNQSMRFVDFFMGLAFYHWQARLFWRCPAQGKRSFPFRLRHEVYPAHTPSKRCWTPFRWPFLSCA